MSRALTVWWEEAEVGTLGLDANGDIGFVYDPAWAGEPSRPAISVSLPKRLEPFSRRDTRAFFAGLLPDETQRDAVARALGVSRQNDFGLLEQLGGDVAGALSLWPVGQAPPAPTLATANLPLSDERLIALLDELPRRPFLAGEEGVRLSLAGAQQKLPVVLVDGAIALPAPGQPSTHILKPPIANLPSTTQNEALAMRLAAAVGLPTAPVAPRRTGERAYLLVERYDRLAGADGLVRRLHQEDFCQAMGISPEHKYAAEGGPIFPQCFDLVRQACAVPAPAVLALTDAAIFNVIVGNADAHGKNYSLLYAQRGVRLAPLYDLMCTAAYPGVHAKLAMKVAGRAQLEEFTAQTWAEFGAEVGVSGPHVRRRAQALARRVAEQVDRVADGIAADGFEGEDLRSFARVIGGRAQQVLALDEADPTPRRPGGR